MVCSFAGILEKKDSYSSTGAISALDLTRKNGSGDCLVFS